MAYSQGEIAHAKGYSERGVILHTLKYSERKLIVHILTRSRGRMSYITNISRGSSRNLYQPLFVVEFLACASRGSMDKILSCELAPTLYNTPFDLVKRSLSIFISELLYRIIREPVDDPHLYDYVEQSVLSLDVMDRGVANFHIWFLVHLTYFLGYGFAREYPSGGWLNLSTGEFTAGVPPLGERVAPQYAYYLWRFVDCDVRDISSIELNRDLRVILLQVLVDYYTYHCDNFGSVLSIEVLGELF
ncbi:MAG: recombination protein O N-terminal domain-containing protein [Rikenellaceae bacterium]